MTPDKPVLGILLMLGFCLLAPLGDALAKLVGARIPLGQLVLVRFGVQAALLVPLVLLLRLPWKLPARIWRLMALRTVLHIAGIALMFSALRYLPLADAIAIAFVMPFIMLLLGHFVLHEVVGAYRIGACLVGFIGTLLVIQPNFLAVGWVALLPLGVAVIFALFMLVTRQIAKQADPVALQAISGVMALALMVPALALGTLVEVPDLKMVMPQGDLLLILGAIGVLGTLAHLLMTWSLRFAPGATLAPMQYLEIPVATVVGFAMFGDWPDALAAAGITLTILAGVFIVLREQASARAAARVAPPAA